MSVEVLLVFILVVLTIICVTLIWICLAIYAVINIVKRPFAAVTHRSLPMRRKDFDVPIVKFAMAKIAVFVAIRYIGKKMR